MIGSLHDLISLKNIGMHTYIHTYIHTYARTYIRTDTYIQTYRHTDIHTYIHSYIIDIFVDVLICTMHYATVFPRVFFNCGGAECSQKANREEAAHEVRSRKLVLSPGAMLPLCSQLG